MKLLSRVAQSTRNAGYKSAKAVLSATHFVGYITCQGALQLEMKLDSDVDPSQIARERTDKSHERMQRIISAATSAVQKKNELVQKVTAIVVVQPPLNPESSMEAVMVDSVSVNKPPMYVGANTTF